VERSYVGPPFRDAKVGHAMRIGVITCRPETKLTDVAMIMVGYDTHSVVVSDTGAAGSWGIVTSLDLAREAAKLDSLTAGEVASTDLVTIDTGASLDRAATVMAENGVSHLIAVQPETQRPVGVISARGIAAAAAHGA
jgi:CBS domain-containing protein